MYDSYNTISFWAPPVLALAALPIFYLLTQCIRLGSGHQARRNDLIVATGLLFIGFVFGPSGTRLDLLLPRLPGRDYTYTMMAIEIGIIIAVLLAALVCANVPIKYKLKRYRQRASDHIARSAGAVLANKKRHAGTLTPGLLEGSRVWTALFTGWGICV